MSLFRPPWTGPWTVSRRFMWLAPPLLAAGLLAPPAALAADVRTGTEVTVAPSEVVNDDVYAFGQTVNIQGTVNGDVIAAGSNTTISGLVTGDVILAGSNATITGEVRGSVRAAAGTLNLGAPIAKDLLAAGGTVTSSGQASVGRDALLGAGAVTLGAPVGRNILASVGDLALQAPVAGNVTGDISTLRLGPNAKIGGNLTYTSATEAQLAPGAVGGTVTRVAPQVREAPNAVTSFRGEAIAWLRRVVGFFAAGLLLVLLWPAFTQRASDKFTGATWASLGIGSAVLLVTPIAAMVALGLGILVGGWWLALIALALYAIATAAAYVLSAFFLARLVDERLAHVHAHPIWQLLFGVAVITLAAQIPFIGGLITIAAIIFGVGALTLAIADNFRHPAAPGLAQPTPFSVAA